ncbi:8317_t:CDS:2 [Ambispora gerdemannii]|uniref:8317_t:CDS:1 n=1 Tax=Ambispora gerdemannii TaxID=144530 RepID=A0A9N8YPD8_9GLOM|nr:8317_t:CDS:2 [Ambispora gerdemannii]
MNVLVYIGPGSSPLSVSNTIDTLKHALGAHYDVIRVDAKVIREEPWSEKTSLFVLPNVKLVKYHEELDDAKINKKILEYVSAGGKYLGFGAGACYALSSIKDNDASLNLLRGIYKAINSNGKSINLELDRQALFHHFANVPNEITFESNQFSSNGDDDSNNIYFDSVDLPFSNYTVLANYKNINDSFTKPAIIKFDFGKGSAILCGIDLPRIIYDSNNELQNATNNKTSANRLSGQLLGSLLEILGMNVRLTDPPDLKLTPLHLTFQRPALADLWLRSARSLIDQAQDDSGKFIIKDKNDTFLVFEVNDTLISTELIEKKNDNDDTTVKPTKMFVYRGDSPSITPFFDFSLYYKLLTKARNEDNNLFGISNNMDFGSQVLYGEVMKSTQSLLEKNPKFLQTQPTGLVCVASQQIEGRGRGRNSWISPLGSLLFSFIIRHPATLPSSSAVFLQYILAVAVVESVISRIGHEDIPLKLKWPNDIYANTSDFGDHADTNSSKFVKIGGILVTSQSVRNEFLMIAGCGINTSNPAPTTSINQIISEYNEKHQTELPFLSQEDLLSGIMVKFASLYRDFYYNNQAGIDQFLKLYYKRWLHTNQIVTVKADSTEKVKIIGITSDYGFLSAVKVDEEGRDLNEIITLQPDGNTFDMMKSMITRKVK